MLGNIRKTEVNLPWIGEKKDVSKKHHSACVSTLQFLALKTASQFGGIFRPILRHAVRPP